MGDTNRRTVRGVAVTLMTEGQERVRTVVTDTPGFLTLAVGPPGDYRLEARRYGYRTTVSQSFEVEPYETVSVDFRVSRTGIPSATAADPCACREIWTGTTSWPWRSTAIRGRSRRTSGTGTDERSWTNPLCDARYREVLHRSCDLTVYWTTADWW